MSIKVYPLIYSRTQKVDFVPDFLARPADLDYRIANKFVAFAMKNVEMDSNDIQRYVVFSVGKYCIAGTACITSNITHPGDEEYIRDKGGKKIQAFIGIAVDKSANNTEIPMLSNEKYREIYLKYLKKQWNEPVTHSEKCTEPEIELETTNCDSFIPQTELILGKNIINEYYYNDNRQRIFNYYFVENLKNNSLYSFIVRKLDLNDIRKSPFNCLVANDNQIRKLQAEEEERKRAEEASRQCGKQSQDEINSDEILETLKKYAPKAILILLAIVVIGCIAKSCSDKSCSDKSCSDNDVFGKKHDKSNNDVANSDKTSDDFDDNPFITIRNDSNEDGNLDSEESPVNEKNTNSSDKKEKMLFNTTLKDFISNAPTKLVDWLANWCKNKIKQEPQKLCKIMDILADNELPLKLDGLDEEYKIKIIKEKK